MIWRQYKKNKVGLLALAVLGIFFLIGLYAPFLTSSKPLVVSWRGELYFPLFRYLFYAGFFTKPIDLFFNLLMFTLPLALLGALVFRRKNLKIFLTALVLIHLGLFAWIVQGGIKDPANNSSLQAAKKQADKNRYNLPEDPLLAPFSPSASWAFDLDFIPKYGQLNQLLEYRQILAQHSKLQPYAKAFQEKIGRELPTLWQMRERNFLSRVEELERRINENAAAYQEARDRLPELMQAYRGYSHTFIMAKYALAHADSETEKNIAEALLNESINAAAPYRIPLANARTLVQKHQEAVAELIYLRDKKAWLEDESARLRVILTPFLRAFHWEDDAGGAQEANQFLPWWELTRINRKDLFSSLVFGIRISIVVGTMAVLISLCIGIPVGMSAGYFAGKTDLIMCRFIEMWEAMPTFFMLLLVIAIMQTKSIFLVVAVLGFFGWTGFARFIRSEVLRQRKLPYVDACHALGFSHLRTMFSHVLPNAIPPVLTLLPFSMMAAITSEAGLSFLGLGEEGSTSWGVLMDEGRNVFPAESYLLWPPAILLTILLVAIALVGDALRDALDPKMQ